MPALCRNNAQAAYIDSDNNDETFDSAITSYTSRSSTSELNYGESQPAAPAIVPSTTAINSAAGLLASYTPTTCTNHAHNIGHFYC